MRMGSPAVPALIQALGDRDEDVRSAACGALGAIGDASAVPALRVHAEWSDAARQALNRLGSAAFPLADAVRQLLAQPDWRGVLGRALPAQSVRDTLIAMGSPAVPALMQALRDEDKDVRSAACEALGAIGDASAVPALIKALGDWRVRSAACRALGAIGDASAVPALINALEDGDWRVRSAACRALERLGYDPPTIPK
ncbi:MAG: hypothetical protein CFK48_10465 [Armatimonadetes bacterium CP1_7O]|nr:MAG: hypothetical protein CFK48_10465 [Armatimonadetes bacterium CP1_7O]